MDNIAASPYGAHLPLFPCLDYQPISEQRIERTVERLFDRADLALMDGRATQAEYDRWSARCSQWADEQYPKIPRA